MLRRLLLVSCSAALALGGALVVAAPAHAAVVCSLDGGTHTLSVSNDGGGVSIEASLGGNLDVTNTDRGPISSIDTVIVDVSDGLGIIRFELFGLRGDDLLVGRPGDDELFDGDGNDTLDGGKGSDVCDQGPGTGTEIACESP
jgi:Ca2+-binding RTX toxin-like protein